MARFPLLAFGILLSVLAACNDSGFSGNGKSAKAPVEKKEPPVKEPPVADPKLVEDSLTIAGGVDLIIAVDSSGSMDDEMQAVASNMGKLLLELQQAKFDPRIHLIMGGKRLPITLPASLDSSKVMIVNEEVDSHNALVQIANLFRGDFAQSYKDLAGASIAATPLRPDAKLEVLVVTDDEAEYEDGDLVAGTFDLGDQGKATVSGIIGLPDSAEAAGVCEIANVGNEYIKLAARSGGSTLDICAQDWTALTTRFSQDVIKRSLAVKLSQEPLDAKNIIVSLDGKALAATDWTYDSATKTVNVTATAAPGMKIVVKYAPKS